MTRSNEKKDTRSQSSDNRTNKTKKLQKGRKKKKYLTYKLKKGEEQKQWKVARILRDRITLVPKMNRKQQSLKQRDFKNQSQKIGFDKVKEFEIQWQPSENGAWANTWQPQENISDFTKLHYLLQKIDQLKSRNLNKQLSEFYKKRETFQNHKKFTNSKYTVKPTQELSQQQKILSIKKILSKQKASPAVKKVPSYKDWYISYSMYEQEFEKIVYRFLRNEPANSSIIQPKKTQKNSVKTKIQFVSQIIPSEQQNVITKHLKSQQNLKTNAQSTETTISLSYMPRQACLRFILNVDYHGNLKNVDYFKLKLFDGQYMYTSEQDLVKYYPFAYQKFLMKMINEATEQAMETLTRIQDKEEFYLSFNQKHISKLSEKIGINDAYSIPFCQEFSTSVLFGNAQAESAPKNKNSICEINRYFDCINLSSDQTPIMIAFDDQEIPYNYPKRNFSDLKKFTQCSILFKKGSKEDSSTQLKQLKRFDQKIQSKSTKKEQLKPKLKQKSIELEANVQVEQKIKQPTKTNSKNKKTKQELSSIQDDSRKQKSTKSVPIENISCQQKQVNNILDLMDGAIFCVKDKEVYDSDDSQSIK